MSKKDKKEDMQRIRDGLRSVGSRSFTSGALNVSHVYPLNDLKEHDTDGAACWCNPTHDGDVVVHNSMDRREEYEQGRKPS